MTRVGEAINFLVGKKGFSHVGRYCPGKQPTHYFKGFKDKVMTEWDDLSDQETIDLAISLGMEPSPNE